jgi:hypothetical protein
MYNQTENPTTHIMACGTCYEPSYNNKIEDEDSSASEEDTWPLPTVHEALFFEMRFGRYKGKTVGSLLKSKKRRDYLRYLSNWDDLSGPIVNVIKVALEEHKKLELVAKQDQKKRKNSRKLITPDLGNSVTDDTEMPELVLLDADVTDVLPPPPLLERC